MSAFRERPQRCLRRMRTEQNLILSSCRSVLTSKSDITPPTSPDTSQSNLRFEASFSSLSMGSLDDLRIPPIYDQPDSSDFPDCGNFGDFAVFTDDENDDDSFDADFFLAQSLDDARSSTEGQSSTNSEIGQRTLQRCDTSFHRAVMIKERSNRSSLNHRRRCRDSSPGRPLKSGHNEEVEAQLSALSPSQLVERFISSHTSLSCQGESFNLAEMDKKSKKKVSNRHKDRATTA